MVQRKLRLKNIPSVGHFGKDVAVIKTQDELLLHIILATALQRCNAQGIWMISISKARLLVKQNNVSLVLKSCLLEQTSNIEISSTRAKF